jgi:hypothetical protein
MTVYKKIETILGFDVRARYKNIDNRYYDLIHKRINGYEIVPKPPMAARSF